MGFHKVIKCGGDELSYVVKKQEENGYTPVTMSFNNSWCYIVFRLDPTIQMHNDINSGARI